jgi:hypothetical protein
MNTSRNSIQRRVNDAAVVSYAIACSITREEQDLHKHKSSIMKHLPAMMAWRENGKIGYPYRRRLAV